MMMMMNMKTMKKTKSLVRESAYIDLTPGLEGTCLSGIDAAEHLLAHFGLNG